MWKSFLERPPTHTLTHAHTFFPHPAAPSDREPYVPLAIAASLFAAGLKQSHSHPGPLFGDDSGLGRGAHGGGGGGGRSQDDGDLGGMPRQPTVASGPVLHTMQRARGPVGEVRRGSVTVSQSWGGGDGMAKREVAAASPGRQLLFSLARAALTPLLLLLLLLLPWLPWRRPP